MTKEVIIKGKKLKLGFDAATMFRYSSKGGCVEMLEGKSVSPDKAFFSLVTLVWAMLKEESQSEFNAPVEMAGLFVPELDKSSLDEIRTIVKEGASKLGKKNPDEQGKE